MKRSAVLLLVLLMLLLGVQRTPEAQVGEAITLATGIVAVGGCAYLALSHSQTQPFQNEPPATP